jgi:hypothetical protein
LGYVVVHVTWAIGEPPRFLNGQESYFPGGWLPVSLALLALGCLAVRATGREGHEGGHYVWAGLTAAAGAALGVYSFLFPVIVVSLVFEGPETGSAASLLATGSGAVGGILCGKAALDEYRLAAHSCPSCGRVHGRSPENRGERAPGWAFAGAYLAVAGFAARWSVWLHDTIVGRWPGAASRADGPSSGALITFVVLMSVAGTLLPLALAHRWGRIWPAWTGPLRARAVPRWLVLGPGLFVGAGLTAYFGIVGMIAWVRGDVSGPVLPLLLEMGGYTLWGIGLLVACASYVALTRPPCRAE